MRADASERSPLPVSDPVHLALAVLAAERGARLLQRFDHGVGGTSLVEFEGIPRVLKAWRQDPAASPNAALELAEIVRGRGVLVPALIEHGIADGQEYLLLEQLPGEWSDDLGAAAIEDLIRVVDAERDAAPTPNPRWAEELASMLTLGDESFDIDPGALRASPEAVAVLEEARARLAACDPVALRTADVVHADFAPENVLIQEGRVTGVVDWERARIGDSGMDLVGALYDVEIWEKAPLPARELLWSAARERMVPEVFAAYVGIYAVRYLSWSVGTDMEDQVLDLVGRLLERSSARTTS